MLDVNFWQGRYDSGVTPWDLGGPSPHFEALLRQPPEFLKPGRMAVPGSGRGHDAALFAKAGYTVTGFDYAPGAIEEAAHLYGDAITWVQTDIFNLADSNSIWAGQFDYVLEHTCFCAIKPQERPRYAAMARNLLKPGGYLFGIFWEHHDPDGPPYSTTESAIRSTFSQGFECLSLTALHPAGGRSGTERLAFFGRLS